MSGMKDILNAIWGPVVEISILAVAIYYVLRFVRGTRGFSILIGFLVVLLTMAFVTSALDLKVLRWMVGLRSGSTGNYGVGPGAQRMKPEPLLEIRCGALLVRVRCHQRGVQVNDDRIVGGPFLRTMWFNVKATVLVSIVVEVQRWVSIFRFPSIR